MGVRQSINQHPALGAAGGAILLVVAIGAMIYANRPTPIKATRAYYSDDDGNTYFVDSSDRIYPFDHNGKPAYRAFVYQCGNAKPFVSYLARYSDSARAKIAALSAKANDPEAAGAIAQAKNNGIELKKPGQTKWVPELSPEGGQIAMHPHCPDGSVATNLTP